MGTMNNIFTMHYCYECDKDVNITIKEENISVEIKGEKLTYLGNVAYCNECGEEIYVAYINDENIEKANRKYRDIIGIIQVDEIEALLEKYNIGQKPLSKLLGWGETTISRYLDGLMPTKEYGSRLKELFNPLKMKELLEKDKGILTNVAQRKIQSKINEILELGPNKPLNVARYFLSKIDVESGESITPLKVQKLVYFSQAWLLGLFNRTFFTEDFQAWQHGPVIPDMYAYFKSLGYNSNDSLPKVSDFDIDTFDEQGKSILEMIWNIYGKFDGKYLEKISHSDEPWRIAWDKREEDHHGNVVISRESIKAYYSSLKEKLNINIDSTESLSRLCCQLNCLS